MVQPCRVRFVWLVALLFVIPAALGAQQSPTGPRLTGSALEIAVGGRVQTLFTTTSVDAEPPSLWELRRVRLDVVAKLNEVVSGKIQPEFAGSRVSLRDAYLLLRFSPSLEVLTGQAFRPFSLLAQTSSTRIPPIERGLRVRGLDDAFDEYNLIAELGYADRDLGLQIRGAPSGAPLGFTYAVGVFNGPAIGQAGGRGTSQSVARVTIQPAEPLRLGVGWSSRDFVLRGEAGQVVSSRRGNAWEIDAEYGSFAPGLHLLGEITTGDFDPLAGASFRGAQLWAAYRTPVLGPAVVHLEPTLRVSYGDPDVDLGATATGGTLLTPGLNLYLGGLNRVMLNYDRWNPAGDEQAVGSFKAMFQLAF